MENWISFWQWGVAAAGALVFLSLAADHIRFSKHELAAREKALHRQLKGNEGPKAQGGTNDTVTPTAVGPDSKGGRGNPSA